MKEILQPKNVVIGFVDKDDEKNDELKVVVGGVAKTCRGFVSHLDSRPHILCNISRFKNTSESDQYKLIHHEFAGLTNVENNEGAASDYAVSSQIIDFLIPETVLRLAVKKGANANCLARISSTTCIIEGDVGTYAWGKCSVNAFIRESSGQIKSVNILNKTRIMLGGSAEVGTGPGMEAR